MEEAPYPGLRPFAESEQGKFFGREADKAILVDKILGNRLTLLFAASGVGKSSLLNAAVIPHLTAAGGENVAVVRNIHWADEPLSRLHTVVRDTLQQKAILPADVPTEGTSLLQLLEMCSLFIRRPPLVLVLDQFEDFFRYNRYHPSFRPFIEQLTAVILDNTLPVSVVISMREDFAMEMNAFKPQLPTLLFENYYRLEKLSPVAATQAILDPVRQVDCDYEPELLQHLLADLKERKRDGLELPHQPSEGAGVEVIDPPYLQIVCGYLWRLKGDGKLLRLADYQRAGGVTGILDYFLNDHLQGLSPAEKQLASRAFDYLAAQRGIKMAYPLAVLATDLLKVKPDKLAAVLDKLARGDMRILHSHERDGVRWYELYHDMYSDSIRNWNTAWKEQQHKRQRLVARVVIGVLLVVLAVLGDSLWWLSRNSTFPAQYLFKEQEFRLMNWGILPEPLPEMVEIPVTTGEFQSGELDKAFGKYYNKSLSEQGAYGQQNFGYPPITAALSAPFAVGQDEITYEQYDYYVWQQHRAGKTEEELPYPTGATRDNGRGQRAVTQVSWDEAVAYTQWLSTKTGKEYRLPTEVEWEYAARAGGKTAYPWGDEVGVKQANCKNCGSDWDDKFIAPVGSFAANEWGLYDTSGNVWEWTCSEWKPELGDDAKQCAGEGASVRRVIRGGSWNDSPDWVRSSARLRLYPDFRNDFVGFRVLRLSRQDN
ncbi:MAG: SUMF1/EgtB/PvdO family nonheme iron enzyme [Candidatus Thiothrix putei]|uniref:SUMF1/EgtB/PvdO family nonheme iron enzyme n=1 Tax=Candidatus Thiothrix putei TaxID=3080811 RepID=A0AA95H8C3_9GAMM|nr:MAG: SUMF1/EgtB/PvdO family nonheme iron enzyme [Candidatus Thiothrix putei]